LRDRYIFPAIFGYAEDGISISFPDIEGCFSCASTDEEAVLMAEEALGLHLYNMEQDGDFIPEPSRGDSIKIAPNERIFLVDVWMPQVRKEVKPVYVKKTLTIPADLNEAAIAANINFSQALTAYLRHILKLQSTRF
jgi:predicted RNase H-like HicB family nuclease